MSESTHESPTRRVKDPLLDHAYDGIREYDNPTPGWWHAIFLGTVVFAFFYFVFFTFSPVSWTPQTRLEKRQVAEFRKIFGSMGELANDVPTLSKMHNDSKMMSVARGLFENNCASCHAKDGGGINGVNLTDNAYKNVKKLEDFYTVISKGANNGAMPGWEQRLSNNERVVLAAYAMSLRGTTPAAPKQPEGVEIPPFVLTK